MMIARTLSAFAVCNAIALLSFPSPVLADPSGGTLSGVSRAPGQGASVHAIVYNGGEQADFSIVGDGDTTLNVIVTDAFGNEIVRTRGPGDRCHVKWHPNRTSLYRIYVVNEGTVFNQYRWRAF